MTMPPEDSLMLQYMLKKQRVLTLGVVLADGPYTGLLSYAMRPDFSATLILALDIAQHTPGLQGHAPISTVGQKSQTGY